MRFFAAVQFLTTIPVPRIHRESDFGASLGYFPLVGLILGLVLAGSSWVLDFLLPPEITNIFIIVLLVGLTGAMHLDGLADTSDALGGHKTVEQRWQVMHDTHHGSFAIVAVSLLLLVKYVALNSLPPNLIKTALIFMPVASRWAMSYAVFAYPYARPSGLGLAFKQGATWPRFLIATIITVLVAVLLMPMFRLAGLAILLCLWVLVLILTGYFKHKFAGLTGDNYGAINEIAEAAVLVLFAVLVKFGLA